MSGPVPSPSMNGMMGLSGTVSRPCCRVMGAPSAGGLRVVDIDLVRSDPFAHAERFNRKLWKSLWKSSHLPPRYGAIWNVLADCTMAGRSVPCTRAPTLQPSFQRRPKPCDYTFPTDENHRCRLAARVSVGSASG